IESGAGNRTNLVRWRGRRRFRQESREKNRKIPPTVEWAGEVRLALAWLYRADQRRIDLRQGLPGDAHSMQVEGLARG
ncbi:hypothetical protein, partial [Salmonella sp. SAL4451]|uniref:hypothetical protein n=1 Tax=Salmonella sp. SAL4451 TaxID=3159906 RepID=UPI00397AD40F